MIKKQSEMKIILGKRLKEVRTKRKLTQKEFVEGVGIGSASLSAYEKGTANPSIVAITAIAQKHNLSVDWLMGLTDNIGNEVEEYKIETVSDVGNVIIGLINAKYDDAAHKLDEIDIKLSVENSADKKCKPETKDNIITFHSQDEKFNKFFDDLCQLKNLLDEDGRFKKEFFDSAMKACIKTLEGV